MSSRLNTKHNHRSAQLKTLTFLVASLSFSIGDIQAQETPEAREIAAQSSYVLSLATDTQGRIWVGTEGSGLWLYDVAQPSSRQWKQHLFNQIGDDKIYALACDKQGRIWAGHLNHGVSVYDGHQWKNYGVLQGPLGEHVTDIAISPLDGDVWMATNAGLTRYSVKEDRWKYYTQGDGLPSNHLQCLTFDQKGTLYVGTQCDGIAIAEASGNYSSWRQVRTPLSQTAHISTGFPVGRGLPHDMINDVLTTRDGAVFVATVSGVARSADGGKTWVHWKGGDAPAKARSTANRPSIAQARDNAKKIVATPSVLDSKSIINPETAAFVPLREDYATCLAEDRGGLLWIGYRKSGYEVRYPSTMQQALSSVDDRAPKDAFVRAILPHSSGAPLIGYYGEGRGLAVQRFEQVAESLPAIVGTPPLPSELSAFTSKELKQALDTIRKVPVSNNTSPTVVELDDDWTTQGDWLGRYGRYWACLAAILAPNDYLLGAGAQPVEYQARISPDDPEDSLRHWVQWLYTKTPESLELPPVYLDSRISKKLTTADKMRRQAEWDDHGEEYEMTKDGPHVYCTVTVPEGQFVLSLYDFNKDGHQGSNRWRDYRISIREHPSKTVSLADIDFFNQSKELANARIRDFRGGVWKRFLVEGPIKLTIEVNRNFSFNTVLAGVMLDQVNEQPLPYFGFIEQQGRKQIIAEELSVWREKKLMAKAGITLNNNLPLDEQLHRELNIIQVRNPLWWASQSRKYYLRLALYYRSLLPSIKSQSRRKEIYTRLGTCYYNLNLYEQWEKCQRQAGLLPARNIEKTLRWDRKSNSSGKGYETIIGWRVANSLTY